MSGARATTQRLVLRAATVAWVALAACRPRVGSETLRPDAGEAQAGAAPATTPSRAPVAPLPAPQSVPSAPPSPAATASPATPASTATAAVRTDWCISGLQALDDDMCFVLPPQADVGPRRLLVYLHGIVPPTPDSPDKELVEGVVLRASTRAGVAALLPRGRRGIGPGHAHDWWAWPTTPSAFHALTPSIVQRWVAAKAKLESLAGVRFDRTYLAGSSSGAYYVAALALRGDLDALGFPVDGFGAMSGGTACGRTLASRMHATKPFYVGFGTYDEETTTQARSLGQELTDLRWPVRVAEHPFGHGAREVYLDEAFGYWGKREGAP